MDSGDSEASSQPKRILRRSDRWLTVGRDAIPLKGNDLPRGEDEFEVEFFEEVLRKDPCEEASLMALGHAYTRRGDYEKGLEIDRRLVGLRPDDPVALYNLSCSLSLMARVDEAFEVLERAVQRGYNDAQHLMADSDLARLREDERFEPFCRRMRLLGPEGQASDS